MTEESSRIRKKCWLCCVTLYITYRIVPNFCNKEMRQMVRSAVKGIIQTGGLLSAPAVATVFNSPAAQNRTPVACNEYVDN